MNTVKKYLSHMGTLWIMKVWKPREELDENGNRTGVVVEGEMYYLSDLVQDLLCQN